MHPFESTSDNLRFSLLLMANSKFVKPGFSGAKVRGHIRPSFFSFICTESFLTIIQLSATVIIVLWEDSGRLYPFYPSGVIALSSVLVKALADKISGNQWNRRPRIFPCLHKLQSIITQIYGNNNNRIVHLNSIQKSANQNPPNQCTFNRKAKYYSSI